MTRKTKERLGAAALTAAALLLLLGWARSFHTRPSATLEQVELHFAGRSGTAAPVLPQAPARAAALRAAHAVPPPPPSRTALPLVRRPSAKAVQTPRAADTRAGASPSPLVQGSASARRRSLLPRTRVLGASRPAVAAGAAPKAPAKSRPLVVVSATPPRLVRDPAPAPEPPPPPVASEPYSTGDLTRWMQLRPAPLPPGIHRHVEVLEGDLTAVATLTQDGVAYEMYLMARLALRELHVVLVRGSLSYYLIDRSFQREGRSFRAGTVRRSGGVITGVVSEERAAASPEAQHFYQVFLSWWDAERLKLP